MTNYSENEIKSLVAFGKKLKVFRSRVSLSQEALAERCGLHRTYIGSAERGERNVSLLNILKIANALGIDASDLLSDD